MIKFKHFIKQKIGFGTIHTNDESDRFLLKPKKSQSIGFGTIHKNDDTDKLLKKLREDTETITTHPLHQKVMDKIEKEYSQGDEAAQSAYRKEHDAKEFEHHHEANKIHMSKEENKGLDKNGIHNSPIRRYTNSSSALNKYLINKHQGILGEPKDYEDFDKKLSSHVNHKQNALKHDTVVHSGAGSNMGEILNKTKNGEKIHFPAYTSTSTHYHSALFFTPYHDSHVMHFHLPKGYHKGRHVNNISVHKFEHEMILGAGQTFQKVHSQKEPKPGKEGQFIHHHHFVPSEE